MIKFALHQYLPKRYLKRASFEDIDRHRMILDFKDGKPYATRWAAREICNSLTAMDLSNTIIVCVPACCKRTNDRRFKEFSNIICERTGAVNGFSHVQVFGHRRKAHIDHVHELAFIDRIVEAGANVSMVLFLAKTKQFKSKSN